MDSFVQEKMTITGAFNSALKKMVTKNKNAAKNDQTIEKLSRLAYLAIDANPFIGLNKMGPYIDRYYDEVESGKVDFFMNLDYGELVVEKEQEKGSSMADAVTQTYINDVMKVAKITKDNWTKFTEAEQSMFVKDFREMIKYYNEYYRLNIRESLGAGSTINEHVVCYDAGTSRNAIFNLIDDHVRNRVSTVNKPSLFVVKISSHKYCVESQVNGVRTTDDVTKAMKIIKAELFEKIDKSLKNRVVIYQAFNS